MNESVFILLATVDSKLCIWECKEQAALSYPSWLASSQLLFMLRTSSVYSFVMFSVAQPVGTHWCVPWVWRRSHRLWPHLQVWHRHWCLWHQVSGWGVGVWDCDTCSDMGLLYLLSQFKGWFNTVPPNNCVPALSNWGPFHVALPQKSGWGRGGGGGGNETVIGKIWLGSWG